MTLCVRGESGASVRLLSAAQRAGLPFVRYRFSAACMSPVASLQRKRLNCHRCT